MTPYAKDGSQINLHHLIQMEPGALVEIPSNVHKKYYKTLHGLVDNGASFRNNPVLKAQYKNFGKPYWRDRAIAFKKKELEKF